MSNHPKSPTKAAPKTSGTVELTESQLGRASGAMLLPAIRKARPVAERLS